LDDDCDGRADEGLLNACGACGPQPAERCDGLDQDCDGAVDEAFDLQRDVRHCGACDAACPYAAADRCRDGVCACGEQAACAADAFCVDRGLSTARCIPLNTLLTPMERP
ncbi:MAG: hypothetical protein KC613_07695, partial [Myxococcales bacterium]|nr:hypothetical protein [Myxococcales bacterium]